MRLFLKAGFAQLLSKTFGFEHCHSRTIATAAIKRWLPCNVGDNTRDIFTPALFVDLGLLEDNLNLLKKQMERFKSVSVRPHIKSHKCSHLAQMQVAHGAVGVCCQTLVEADAMVTGGVKDVFITNQMIGLAKLRHVANLAKNGGKISVCVDDANNINDINTAAAELGVVIDCVVEVNVGQNRCGVEPGEPAVKLAQIINSLPNVNFKGLHCYQGLNQHVRSADDRKAAVQRVVQKTQETLAALSAQQIPCDYVTGGGTGTFLYESESGVFTEVQPGSYVFMDADYNRNLGEDGKFCRDFHQSLFILSTVQSVTPGDRAVVDAGMKAVSLDSGVPLVIENPDLTYTCGGDEHGIIQPCKQFKVGDLIRLIPGHCDPTVNLYDWLIGVRGDKVETVWPIAGRGPGI